jgi:hypothetical protein
MCRELRLLERQTHRGDRDSVDHPRRGSDDLANALCGCAVCAVKPGYDVTGNWISGTDSGSRAIFSTPEDLILSMGGDS